MTANFRIATFVAAVIAIILVAVVQLPSWLILAVAIVAIAIGGYAVQQQVRGHDH